MASLYADHARELLCIGPEYHMASWKHKDATKSKPERLQVELMTAPLLEDGRVAWKYGDPKSRKKVEFTFPDHDQWTLAWEQKTGKCRQCATDNPGQEFVGWNHITGTKYKTCTRCGGTGTKP